MLMGAIAKSWMGFPFSGTIIMKYIRLSVSRIVPIIALEYLEFFRQKYHLKVDFPVVVEIISQKV